MKNLPVIINWTVPHQQMEVKLFLQIMTCYYLEQNLSSRLLENDCNIGDPIRTISVIPLPE